jgi:hypothetical protein
LFIESSRGSNLGTLREPAHQSFAIWSPRRKAPKIPIAADTRVAIGGNCETRVISKRLEKEAPSRILPRIPE